MGDKMEGFPAFLLILQSICFTLFYLGCWIVFGRCFDVKPERQKRAHRSPLQQLERQDEVQVLVLSAANTLTSSIGYYSSGGTTSSLLQKLKGAYLVVKTKLDHKQFYFFQVAFWTVVTTGMSQFADVHVSGSFQSILNLLVLPGTMVCARVYLGTRFNLAEITGSALTILGTMVAVFPSIIAAFTQSTLDIEQCFWIAVFAGGCLLASINNVLMENVLGNPAKYKTNVFEMLFHVCLYSIPGYLLMILVPALPYMHDYAALKEMLWTNQMNALNCFMESPPHPSHCKPGATFWTLMYISTYSLAGLFQSILIYFESATFQAVALAITTPTAALAFCWKFIGEEHTEPLTWNLFVSLAILVVGVLVYKSKPLFEKLLKPLRSRTSGGEDEEAEIGDKKSKAATAAAPESAEGQAIWKASHAKDTKNYQTLGNQEEGGFTDVTFEP